MSETTEKAKRPVSITIICVVGFLGVLIAVPLVFSSIAQQLGPWYPPYLALSTLVGFVCMVGLWMMKRWAAYAYTGFAVLNQGVLLAMGIWGIVSLLVPAVVVFFALKHAPRMS